MGDGELEALGVALFRVLVNHRPAGIGQAEYLGRFVEGLTRGIVDGATQTLHIEMVVDLQQQGMAARNRQAEKGKLRVRMLLSGLVEEVGQHVRLQVVHLHQRDVQRVGHRLRKRTPHQQRT